jgi:hypothetical protein
MLLNVCTRQSRAWKNYENYYAVIKSRVRQSLAGPVKTFTMDDGMPIVMQHSIWDTKFGPATAILVGDANLMVSIPADELNASMHVMDVLAACDICDMSKDFGSITRATCYFSPTPSCVTRLPGWQTARCSS